MRHRLRGAVVIVALFSASVPAFAHHGYATEFDITKCENLKGTLSGVEWENPHAFFSYRCEGFRRQGKYVEA